MKTKNIAILAGFFAAVLIGASLANGYIFRGRLGEKGQVKETKASQTEEIKISAYRFGYEPTTIAVKKGQRIRLIIDNTDTLHGVRIPELGLAGNDRLEFTADKIGEFQWFCNNFCGQGHQAMSGKLIVQ